ncbi:MAG: hypothetical protein JEY96_19785 [Bacteroidales bacterium]|nr:hypothetical protein [Bacteroidales bacterium]
MNTIEIKNNFHKLIDRIDNNNILSKFYSILEQASTLKDGQLWNKLTEEEKHELFLIDNETDNNQNLISHSTIQEKHKKWLEK